MGIRGVIVTTFAGACVLAAGAEGTALAYPPPRPLPSPAVARPVARGHHVARLRTVRRARHHRPRAVVRCQSDGTDQVDEIDNDGEEPRHYVSPDVPAPAVAGCPGARQALGIANLLDGGHGERRIRRVPRSRRVAVR